MADPSPQPSPSKQNKKAVTIDTTMVKPVKQRERKDLTPFRNSPFAPVVGRRQPTPFSTPNMLPVTPPTGTPTSVVV